MLEHTCHWPDCPRAVPERQFMCFAHWMKIPQEFRDAIWRHYRKGQEIDKRPSAAYIQTVKDCMDWIASQKPPATGDLFK